MGENEIIKESGTLRLSDEIWAEARRRVKVIAPIAEHGSVSKTLALEGAQKFFSIKIMVGRYFSFPLIYTLASSACRKDRKF